MSALANVAVGEDGTTVLVGDQPLDLTGSEVRILKHLLQAGDRKLCTKPELETAMHNGGASRATSNVVEVLISRIRKRLRAAGAGVEINTLHRRGYELRALQATAEAAP